MTNIDEQLALVLERRAERVVVRDDLESILGGTNVIRSTDPTARRPSRPQLLLVAAAGLVAITGGLAWAQSVRNEPAVTSERPPPPDESVLPTIAGGANAAPWDLPASANPDRIDAYPIVDDLPDAASATLSDQPPVDERAPTNIWIGSIGTLRPDGVPQSIVAVSTFAQGFEPFPEAVPGRVEGVSEIFGNGHATLAWTVDETPLTMTGGDLDTMYSLVQHIFPIAGTGARGGYAIIGDLPPGMVELEAPYEVRPMGLPSIYSEGDGELVLVESGPFLSVTAASGFVDREPITIGSLSGFIADDRVVDIGSDRRVRTLIALALNGDETMFVSSSTMSREQLIDFAGTIRIGDEVEFRSFYGLTD